MAFATEKLNKKRSWQGDVATKSSLQLCGFEPTPEYLEVMHDLDGASICPPGRQRPSSSALNRLYAPSQSKRHQQYSPPGFNVLNDIDGPNHFIKASKSLEAQTRPRCGSGHRSHHKARSRPYRGMAFRAARAHSALHTQI